MTVHVAMIVRNEMSRHLSQAVACAMEVADLCGGEFIVTDDCSDDGTYEFLRRERLPVRLRQNYRPMFMEHEGRARQQHLEWTARYVAPGDWVLSLDADETINSPEILQASVKEAEAKGKPVILMPLYEFWSEEPPQYRVDGFWFGTQASRLYRWQEGGQIQDREFGCGSEPTYVAGAVRRGEHLHCKDLHLLHWGYSREHDRVAKHERYVQRMGGHGHNNRHVQSIVSAPTLRSYP